MPSLYLCCARPSLEETLADKAPNPFSLKEFESYLRNNHCVESLEFYFDVIEYAEEAQKLYGSDDDEVLIRLKERWNTIIQTYISADSPKEVNITDENRQRLSSLMKEGLALLRDPVAIQKVVEFAIDTIRESVYQQFVNEQNLCAVMGSRVYMNSKAGEPNCPMNTVHFGTNGASKIYIGAGSRVGVHVGPSSTTSIQSDSGQALASSLHSPELISETSGTRTVGTGSSKTSAPIITFASAAPVKSTNTVQDLSRDDNYTSGQFSTRRSNDSIESRVVTRKASSTSSSTTQPSPRSQTFSDEGDNARAINIVESISTNQMTGTRNESSFRRLSFLHRDKTGSGSDDEHQSPGVSGERGWDKAKHPHLKKVGARIRKLYG